MKSIEQICEERRVQFWKDYEIQIRKEDLQFAWIFLAQAYFFIGIGFFTPNALAAAAIELCLAIKAYRQSQKPL